MWEDKFRTIERSKPDAQPAPDGRLDMLKQLVDPRELFRKKVHLYLGFAGFFFLGTIIGVFLGSSDPGGERVESALDSTEHNPELVRPDPPMIDRPDLKVRAYAYTTRPPRVEVPPTSPATEEPVNGLEAPARSLPIRPHERSQSTGEATERLHSDIAPPPIAVEPAWLAYAVPQSRPAMVNAPMIALVIDDLGIDQKRTRKAISLPAPLTMAFLPYGYHLAELTEAARREGHELLVHLPMQPTDSETDPGPNALLRGLGPQEIRERIQWNLSRFDKFVGVNNHMGSAFTRWEGGMNVVLEEMKDRGLLYLDSLTSGESVAANRSSAINLPFAVRDVFLDNDPAPARIRRQLDELERIARQRGYAIGIGHPHDTTISVLRSWLNAAKERGLRFVPISVIVKRRYLFGQEPSAAPAVSSPVETPDRSSAG